MADLDDFFAKKDRKKSKSVKKFATADELAKKLEDSKQKPDSRPKKERPATEGEEGGRGGEEEEWKEYEEPVKDYTGLKIQVLQGGNGAAESGRDSAGEETTGPEGGKVKGPWNKTGQQVEEPVAAPPPAPVEEKAPAAPKPYVPPSRVRQPEPVRRNQAKHAPDIHNDDYFPQLGAAAKRGGGGWSTAGGGGQRPSQPQGGRQTLALGNRFTSLQDDS